MILTSQAAGTPDTTFRSIDKFSLLMPGKSHVVLSGGHEPMIPQSLCLQFQRSADSAGLNWELYSLKYSPRFFMSSV